MFDKEQQITKNFQLKEFFATKQPGFDMWESFRSLETSTQGNIYKNILFMAHRLQVIRMLINGPITITSGFRTQELNDHINKKTKTFSYHMLGNGIDFVVSQTHHGFLRAILKNWDGGYKFYDDGHFHLDLGAERRW